MCPWCHGLVKCFFSLLFSRTTRRFSDSQVRTAVIFANAVVLPVGELCARLATRPIAFRVPIHSHEVKSGLSEHLNSSSPLRVTELQSHKLCEIQPISHLAYRPTKKKKVSRSHCYIFFLRVGLYSPTKRHIVGFNV